MPRFNISECHVQETSGYIFPAQFFFTTWDLVVDFSPSSLLLFHFWPEVMRRKRNLAIGPKVYTSIKHWSKSTFGAERKMMISTAVNINSEHLIQVIWKSLLYSKFKSKPSLFQDIIQSLQFLHLFSFFSNPYS